MTSESRASARSSLVHLRHAAVPALLATLASPGANLRWEAARVLREIGDPQAAPALTRALEDDSFDVRWMAAEGLIALRQDALGPLLQALEQDPTSEWLLEGAHHVLDALDKADWLPATVQPVLATLEGPEPNLTVPIAAHRAL